MKKTPTFGTVICPVCKDDFTKYSSKHKFCSDNCRNKFKINNSNERWASREYKETLRGDSDKVAYSFFKKKQDQTWMKKFNVMRG